MSLLIYLHSHVGVGQGKWPEFDCFLVGQGQLTKKIGVGQGKW